MPERAARSLALPSLSPNGFPGPVPESRSWGDRCPAAMVLVSASLVLPTAHLSSLAPPTPGRASLFSGACSTSSGPLTCSGLALWVVTALVFCPDVSVCAGLSSQIVSSPQASPVALYCVCCWGDTGQALGRKTYLRGGAPILSSPPPPPLAWPSPVLWPFWGSSCLCHLQGQLYIRISPLV